MRNSIYILETLQDLGFLYHIDEPSRDEPFIRPGPWAGLRHRSLHLSLERHRVFSLRRLESGKLTSRRCATNSTQLYEEGAHQRRMMVASLHDRISGHAGRVRALDRFLTYARSKGDVWFARKDENRPLRAGQPRQHAGYRSGSAERHRPARAEQSEQGDFRCQISVPA